MRRIVVDPNVMVKWFVEEEFTECAERLRPELIIVLPPASLGSVISAKARRPG